VTIDEGLAGMALRDALEQFPQFSPYGPELKWRALYQGGAFYVGYREEPPKDLEGVWDFQNAVVKGYKRLAGG
jgi:hypothetical protein